MPTVRPWERPAHAFKVPARRKEWRWEDIDFPPGFLGDLARLCHETQMRPSKPFAINNAMVLGGVLESGKVVVDSNLAPNEYALHIAPPNGGKQRNLTFPQDVLRQIGVRSRHISGGVTSRPAGMKALARTQHFPVLLIQQDEAAGILRNASNAANGRGGTTGADSMVRFLTEALTIGLSDLLSESTRDDQGISIHAPAVNLVWCVQPVTLARVVSIAMFQSGAMGRFTFAVEPELQGNLQTTAPTIECLLQIEGWAEWTCSVLDRARTLWNYLPNREPHEAMNMEEAEDAFESWLGTKKEEQPRKCPVVPIRPIHFGIDPEAELLFEEFLQWTMALANRGSYEEQHSQNLVWGRACELAKKKALKIAGARCILDGKPPVIIPEEAEWSIHAAEASIRDVLEWWETFGGDRQQRHQTRIYLHIKKQKGWVKQGQITKKFNGEIERDDRAKALEQLVQSGKLEMRPVPPGKKGGAPTHEYRIARKRRGNDA